MECDSNKDTLGKLVDRVAMLSLLALPSDRGDIVQKRVLRSAVKGTKWGLHAEMGGYDNKPYQTFVENQFASNRVIERQLKAQNETTEEPGILYAG